MVEAERGAPRANLTSYPRALWWSVETATTVGYGDFYPVTLWGRVIACVLMFAGATVSGGIGWRPGWGADAHELHERFDRLERLLERGADGRRGW